MPRNTLAAVEVLPPARGHRDAVEIGQLYRTSKQLILDSVPGLIACGHKLAAKKKEVGHGHWIEWVDANADDFGFGVRTADRLMRGAAKLDASVQFDEKLALQVSREMWGHQVRGTGEFERYTPAEYIPIVRRVLGEIDLDPATCKTAQARRGEAGPNSSPIQVRSERMRHPLLGKGGDAS